MVRGHKQGEGRQQMWLSAPCLDEFVGEDNAVRVIDAFVDMLDMEELGMRYAKVKGTGRLPYNPGDMLKLYIYGYSNRVRSSRRLETETQRNVEVMWLIKGLRPDDKTISNFRHNNAQVVKKVFSQFNRVCLGLGLFGGETVGIDGSKFRANNGRKNCYTDEAARKVMAKLDGRIEDYLCELDENDAQEQAEPDRKKVLEALNKLTKRKEEMEEILKKITEAEGEAVCTVDPEAKLMKQSKSKGYDVCYNVQTAVDEKHGLIVGYEVTDCANDYTSLSEMSMQAKETMQVKELTVLADTGYSSGVELNTCEQAGIKCYVPAKKLSHQPEDERFHKEKFIYDAESDTVTCPMGNQMTYIKTKPRNGNRAYTNRAACRNCPCKQLCTKNKYGREYERSPYQADIEQAAARARENPDLYSRRKELSEHPFGTVKSVWGYGQFHCRGKTKTAFEAGLAFLSFNIRRAITILGTKKLTNALRSLFSWHILSVFTKRKALTATIIGLV